MVGPLSFAWLARGAWGQMVALRGVKIVDVPIGEAVRILKTVPMDGHRVRAARAMGLCLGDQ